MDTVVKIGLAAGAVYIFSKYSRHRTPVGVMALPGSQGRVLAHYGQTTSTNPGGFPLEGTSTHNIHTNTQGHLPGLK